jgi:lipoteichoic acid synthase
LIRIRLEGVGIVRIIVKQKSGLLINFIVFYFLIQMLTFNRLGLNLYPTHLLLDLLLAGVLGTLIFLFQSNRIALIYLSLWMFCFGLLFIVNITIYQIFGDIFSIENLFLLNEAGQAFDASFLNMGDLLISFCLFVVFILSSVLINRLFRLNQAKYRKPKRLKRIFVFLMIFSFSLTTYFGYISYLSHHITVKGETFTERFYLSTLKKSALQSYGMLSFYYREAAMLLDESPGEGVDDEIKQDITPYSGLLKDMNVITIMIESGQEMAINPVLTPNLSRLREEGLYFSENYSVNKTNVSEQIGIVGSYPTTRSSEIGNIPFAFPNLLNDKYVTRYFHDNNEEFYQRGTLLQQFGFENTYFHNDLFPEELPNWDGDWSWSGDYTLDSVTIERILPHLLDEDEPFYSFWTTLSMHGPYANHSKSNRDLFQDLGYFDAIDEAMEKGEWENPLLEDETGAFQFKYYQAAMMDFDRALGRLLEDLENKELLDSTLLVLYSDHHVYYHDLHLRLNGVEVNESYKMDLLYDTILYMWNPVLNEAYENDHGTTTIETFTSPYIIVPTVLDLLGIPHNSNTYLSLSVFNEEYLPLFYSHQHKAIMDNIYYTRDVESILYQAIEEDEEAQAAFLLNCLKLLQRQSKLDELYYTLRDHDQ